MEGPRATTAYRPTREKQQRKCSSCGKLGHTTSHCWLVHPELRPQDGKSQGGKSARKDPRPLQSPEVSSKASLQFMPFRFLDLPGEIRNRIYDEIYGVPYSVTAKMSVPNSRYEHDKYELDIPRRPELHIVSKQIYRETTSARSRDSFDGHLRCELGPILPLNSEPKYARFRDQVTKMTFFGFTSQAMAGVDFPTWYWCGMEEAFPNLQEIHLEWTRNRIFGRKSKLEMLDILRGRYDCLYSGFIDRLKVPFLAKHVNTRRNWKIIFTTTLRWIAGNYEHALQVRRISTIVELLADSIKDVKFRVTEHGRQVVERMIESDIFSFDASL